MRKVLLSLAVAGVFTCVASAGDLTLYGVVDTGLSYKSIDWDGASAYKNKGGDSFSIESGINSSSRFGLRGSEEIGDGVIVGFVLENGFDSDTGSLTDDDRFFNRESQLFVKTQFGTLSMGRVGTLVSDNGSFGLTANLSPFASGWSNVGSQTMVFATEAGRRDNTVTYVSPTFVGINFYAQYAMGDSDENKSYAENGRYSALGLTYQQENLEAVFVVDYLDKDSSRVRHGDDAITVTAGVNYTCPGAVSYLGAQYFSDVDEVGGSDYGFKLPNGVSGKSYGDLTGYGVISGVDIPLAGGVAKFSLGYMKAESDRANKEVSRALAGIGYEYPLSKRTGLYTAAGYVRDSVDNANPAMVQVVAGLKHSF